MSTMARVVVLAHVSIHAPAWGATTGHDLQRDPKTAIPGFNPRPRVGGDLDILLDQVKSRLLAVSIHAPAWGATRS